MRILSDVCPGRHGGECHGEIWQCVECDEFFCQEEGAAFDDDLCDTCWSKYHIEVDLPAPRQLYFDWGKR
jgi:hypothetical protein